jgi:hypothetical protein
MYLERMLFLFLEYNSFLEESFVSPAGRSRRTDQRKIKSTFPKMMLNAQKSLESTKISMSPLDRLVVLRLLG